MTDRPLKSSPGSDIPVIAVDGPAGVGKGTLAKYLATKYDFNYLDSGAIYRVVALAAIEQGLDRAQIDDIVECASNLHISFPAEKNYSAHSNNIDIDNQIRSEACSSMASRIAAEPVIRAQLLMLQKRFQRPPGLVCDGRDMGTVVFPEAKVKIFLDASVQQRAERRYKQLIEKGISASFAHLFDSISARDERDRSRASSPLVAAEDAWVIDTTEMTIEKVIGAATDYIDKTL